MSVRRKLLLALALLTACGGSTAAAPAAAPADAAVGPDGGSGASTDAGTDVADVAVDTGSSSGGYSGPCSGLPGPTPDNGACPPGYCFICQALDFPPTCDPRYCSPTATMTHGNCSSACADGGSGDASTQSDGGHDAD